MLDRNQHLKIPSNPFYCTSVLQSVLRSLGADFISFSRPFLRTSYITYINILPFFRGRAWCSFCDAQGIYTTLSVASHYKASTNNASKQAPQPVSLCLLDHCLTFKSDFGFLREVCKCSFIFSCHTPGRSPHCPTLIDDERSCFLSLT